MFETETMAELYVKQGMLKKAVGLYQQLADAASDEITRARRRQRISELTQQLADAAAPATTTTAPATLAPATTAPPPPAPRLAPLPAGVAVASAGAPLAPPRRSLDLPLPGVRAEWDRRHVVLHWRLPADTALPALDLLLVMRTAAGIITERRTLPLATAEGRTALPVPDLHSVRVAAGRMDGPRFVPIVRVGSDP